MESIPGISIETSEPIQEGNIVITNKQAINGNLPFGKTDIEKFDKLTQNKIISQKEKDSINVLQAEESYISIPFEDTRSFANLSINKESLSTLVLNENVEFKIELGNNSEQSDLYTDPMFDIEMPQCVEDIEIKNQMILYDDELKIESIEKYVNANGRIAIRVKLYGTQTRFSVGSITNGTNIIFNTDIKINILTPNVDDEIKMYYYNADTKNYVNQVQTDNGIIGYAKIPISIVSKVGLINVSNWKNFDGAGRYVMSVGQGPIIEQIGIFGNRIQSVMSQIIVNNTGNVCDDICVLVRVPGKGNKAILTGEDFGNTQDTYLRSYMQVEGADKDKFKIYYSENADATRDLTDANNGWNEKIVDANKIKSCLIIGNNYQMQPGELISFSYQLEIPDGMSYNNMILTNFATYYTEHAQEYAMQNETQSDIVGISTGRGPELNIVQEVSGADDDGKIKEMGLLKYKVTVTNTGTETAQNVVITDKLPKWTSYVRSSDEKNTSYMNVEMYPQEGNTNDVMRQWNVIQNGDLENR